MSQATSLAAKYALCYAGLATVWIFSSDSLVSRVAANIFEATELQIAKGCGFVAITALVLFMLIRHFAIRLLFQEQQLAAGELQYRLMFEANPQPMWVYASDTLSFLAANEAAVAQYGYSREEFLAMTLNDIHPAEDVSRWLAHTSQLHQGRGLAHSGLWRHRRRDGRAITVDITSHPLEFAGRLARVVLARDVTDNHAIADALRVSEELNRAVLDSMLAQLAVLDREGRIQAVNEAWQRCGWQYGDSTVNTGVGADYFAACRTASGDQSQGAITALEGIQAVLAGRRDSFTLEYPCRVLDREHWFLMSVTPLRTAVGGAVVAHIDITEHKQLEQTLVESEQRFRDLFEYSPVAYQALDNEGRFLDVNDKLCELLGYTREELLGRSFGELWVGEIRAGFAPILDNFKRDNQINVELRLLRKESSRLTVLLEGRVQRDARGCLVRIHCILADISERKAMEDALHESGERLKLALAASRMGVWEWTIATDAVFWSPECYAILESNQTCETLDAFTRLLHPEDKEWVMAAARHALATGETYAAEFRVMRPDGAIRWLSNLGQGRYDANGKPLRLIGTVQDITERKQAEAALRESEERYRAVVEDQTEIISRFTEDGRITFVNEVYCRFFGKSSQDVLGQHWQPQAVVEDIPDIQAKLRQLTPAQPVVRIENRVYSGDGQVHWMQFINRGLFDDEGRLTAIQSVGRDITERVRAEAERELLQRQLQQAQKMEAIGQLTGGIAHDFNNILASILGYTELALERHVPDPYSKLADYLQQVRIAGERARDLIAKMLAFSRSSSRAEPLPFSPKPLVGEVVRMLASAIPSSIELATYLDALAPPILIDPVDLHQVITNLVINARDAIGGTGRIDIALYGGVPVDAFCTACHYPIQGEFVEISVADTGIGIAADILPRIFDPFFTTKAVGKGTGMGLSVVLGIVHRVGGHMLVETRPGVGTVFRMLFPAAVETPLADSVPSAPSLPEPQRLRVLVVDDEPILARLWAEILETHGQDTRVFSDSREALACFAAAPEAFDAVITDQTMPGLMGSELAAELLRLKPELVILLCTGYSDQIDAEEATRRGIRYFFKKPVRPAELLAALAESFPKQTRML